MMRTTPLALFAAVIALTQVLPAYAAETKQQPVRHRHQPAKPKATSGKAGSDRSASATIKAATPPPPSTQAEAGKTAVGTSMKVMPP